MTDCLLVGFNDSPFDDYLEMVRSMGKDSGAYRDLNLAYVDYEGRPYRSMDLLNYFFSAGRREPHHPFSNTDFLWPTILYLGTYLTRRGFSFDYVNQFQREKEAMREKLERGDVLLVAITTTLYVTAHPILEILSFIRQCNERVRVVVGGPYISNQAQMLREEELQELLKLIGADFYVISQEGEQALAHLLAALKAGGGFDRIDNIAYRERGRYVRTASSAERNELAENPVDYSLFGPREIGQFVSLRTAKSCPFSCAFCGFPQRAGKYIYLGGDLVERELNALSDLGTVTTITFLDDTFNVPKPRFKEILRMMIRNRYGFKWNSFYRSDHGDEEAIELMREAGCEGVFLGIESGSDAMLQRMNKSSRRHHYMKAIPLFRQAGISTYASLIVGFPGETRETVEETLSLVEEAQPEYFRAQLWYCDPMTPIWNRREEFGVKGSAFNWSHDTMDFRTACELIDRIFLAVEGSTWLPQNGFEQWSTFYLQRRGMTKDRLSRFLCAFNAAVRDQLLHPERETIPPDLALELAASCRFDEEAPPPLTIEAPSYRRSERFWAGELSQARAVGLRGALAGPWREAGAPASRSFPIGAETAAALRERLGAELQEIVLAAYGLLLSRVAGSEEIWLLATLELQGARVSLPLRLPTAWDLSFAELVRQVEGRVKAAAEHQAYAFYFLGGRRAPQPGPSAPLFEAAYVRSGPDETLALPGPPDVGEAVGLVLRMASDEEEPGFDLLSTKGWCQKETLEALGSYLVEILTAGAEDSGLILGEFALGNEARSTPEAPGTDAEEIFNF